MAVRLYSKGCRARAVRLSKGSRARAVRLYSKECRARAVRLYSKGCMARIIWATTLNFEHPYVDDPVTVLSTTRPH